MLGHLTKDTFKPDENYESFYKGHVFAPWPEEYVTEADRILPRVGWAVEYACEKPGARVLDLGCLDGFNLFTLWKKGRIQYGHGVDLSEPGIKLASKRVKDHDAPLEFWQMPAERYLEGLAKGGTKYDLICLFEFIEHVTDPQGLLRLVNQSLAKAGTVLISTPDAEGEWGIGNDDPCHLRIYSHKDDTADLISDKPVISLPGQVTACGGTVVENEVWNGLVHTAYTV